MKILILGAGAVGGYFGGLIARLLLLDAESAFEGADVTFLVRSNRADQLKKDGLRIEDPGGQITAVSPINILVSESIATTNDSNLAFDVIILACKAYGLLDALAAIAPFVHRGVAILPLLNGIAHIDAIEARFPEATVWGGTCGIVATLTPDGTVKRLTESQFIAAGVRRSSDSRVDDKDATLASLIGLMRRAGIEAHLSDTITLKMWEKWTFLATLAAATCLLDGSIGEILATGDAGHSYIQGVFQECDAVAVAEGGIAQSEDESIQNHRQHAYTRHLQNRNSPVRASMARDMAAGNPTEADHILGDMIRRAKIHGIETPLLSIAYARLLVYENLRTKKLLAKEDPV
jgi:2-dehydropantoate 2-reductase